MRRGFSVLMLLLVVLGAAGCASTGEDDISARPWNEQRTWETGLPSGMYEGR